MPIWGSVWHSQKTFVKTSLSFHHVIFRVDIKPVDLAPVSFPGDPSQHLKGIYFKDILNPFG